MDPIMGLQCWSAVLKADDCWLLTPSGCTGLILSWASCVCQQYWRQNIAGFWHHLDVLDGSYHGPPVLVSSIGGRRLLASDTIRMYWMDSIMGLQCLSAVLEAEYCWLLTPSGCTGWILSWASSVCQQYQRQKFAGFQQRDKLCHSFHTTISVVWEGGGVSPKVDLFGEICF